MMTKNIKKLTDKELAHERLRVIFWWQRVAGLMTLVLSLRLMLTLLATDETSAYTGPDLLISLGGTFSAAAFFFTANKTRKVLGFRWFQF